MGFKGLMEDDMDRKGFYFIKGHIVYDYYIDGCIWFWGTLVQARDRAEINENK